MDLNRYIELRDKGTITIHRTAKDRFMIVCKRYDPLTGNELPPQQQVFNIKDLRDKLSKLDSSRLQVEAILADFESKPFGEPKNDEVPQNTETSGE